MTSAPLRKLASLPPSAILAIGWGVMLLYAYPGYMSYDSVYQLAEARSGVFSNGHPPAMAALWQVLDTIISGPILMLVAQVTCFLVGTYFVAQRFLTPRAAAWLAVAVLLFPPVSLVMAPIWKDGQMAAYVMLGTGLLLRPGRRAQIAGLVWIGLGTAMRHNALAITLPIVGLLFVWNPAHRWWQRYALAAVAWVAITLAARGVNNYLTVKTWYVWHESVALFDITSTLRYADPISDAEMKEIFGPDEVPVMVHNHIQQVASMNYADDLAPTWGLWWVTKELWRWPLNEAERAAVSRTWKRVVLHNPRAFLTYRWQVFKDILQLSPQSRAGSAAYIWFVDVTDPPRSIERTDHTALPGKIQAQLREGAVWIGSTWLFRVYLYAALAIVLLPLVRRDGRLVALVLSAYANEALLFLISPSTDYRYSLWLVITDVLVAGIVVLRRRYALCTSDVSTKQ